jgi:hypothetical protein
MRSGDVPACVEKSRCVGWCAGALSQWGLDAGARTATTAKGPGRPRGTGARAQEVLKLVHTPPGITVSELAEPMKIKPNYLYRVFSHLERDGQVTKRDKGYHPPEK